MRKIFSERELVMIKDLHNYNFNTVEISNMINRSQSAVERNLKNMGHIMNYSRRINKDQYNDIINLYNSGWTCQEIYVKYSQIYSCEEAIQRIISKAGISRGRYKKESIVNHDYFENIDCERKAYWLGFLLADGCVRKKYSDKNSYTLQLEIHHRDKYLLEEFIKDIESDRRILTCKNETKNNIKVTIYSEKIYEDLHKYGVVERKTTKIKEIPHIQFNMMNHFIRGYFDGDGCITLKKPKDQYIHRATAFFCGTQKFLECLNNLLSNEICLKDTKLINMNKYGSNVFNLRYCRNDDIVKLYDYMYEDATIFLNRKKSKFEKFINERK